MRWRIVLIGGTCLLVVYYGLAIGSMQLGNSGSVSLDDSGVAQGANRITLEVEAVNLDTSTGSFDLRMRPLPRGTFADPDTGELREPLQVKLISAGSPAQSFDFPSQQLVDPVGATVDASAGAQGFPFDRPKVDFRLESLTGDHRVPVDIEMSDQTEGWNLSGKVGERDNVLRVDLKAGREMLAVSFTLFYIGGIVVVALITVALIGGSIARGQVDFGQVIWLGAMLVAVPAVRNEMPGVPPIGTAVDMYVFLPSVFIVGAALLASIVVLAINEHAASRAPTTDAE